MLPLDESRSPRVTTPRGIFEGRRAVTEDLAEFRAVYEAHFRFVWGTLRRLGVREADALQQILEERGNDYYAPTELGSRIATLKDEWRVSEEDPAAASEHESSLTRLAIYAAVAALIIFLFIAWRYS